MGRRAIKNLEEKILQEVIRLTNKKGLESLLTREVANNLKISEPTIFSHFKTKYNLLINAFLEAHSLINFDPCLPLNREPKEYEKGLAKFKEQLERMKDNMEPLSYIVQYLSSPYFAENTIEQANGMFRSKINEVLRNLEIELTLEKQNHISLLYLNALAFVTNILLKAENLTDGKIKRDYNFLIGGFISFVEQAA